MDTVEQAIQSLQLNESPYWWLYQGNGKVAQNIKETDMQASVQALRNALALLPPGSYKLEHSQKTNDRSGSFKFPFMKGTTVQALMQPAQPVSTNNPYNIPDDKYKQLESEIRHKLSVERVLAKVEVFLDEWPDYKKKIDTLWNEDQDGDGIPDIMDTVKKAGEAVTAVGQVKNAFKGASLFE
ncbi:hypothetical protein [Spirosoma endophyticum]|uniref:Uncharacterized protein n=1 Tax=Spirosoma endophyticum TaxID=662367 RepID=A0A1I1UFI5_9BACT|nr:hypothetical protein [Spirosoma endophyticum]SFD67533.1 hypothetical protein SAMN05216167_106182 [Spirosoma endophyticum]